MTRFNSPNIPSLLLSSLRQILATLIVMCCPILAYPQVEAKLDNISDEIEYGEYKDAQKDIDNLRSDGKVKAGTIESAQLLIIEGQAMGGTSHYTEMESIFNRALGEIKKLKGATSPEYYFGLYHAAETYADYAFYAKAADKFSEAKKLFPSLPNADSAKAANLLELECHILSGQGYYLQAIPKIEQLVAKRRDMIEMPMADINPATGQKYTNREKKNYKLNQKRAYGRAIALRGRALTNKGQYPDAIADLENSRTWILSEIGKDRSLVDVYYELGRNYYIAGDFQHCIDILDKATGYLGSSNTYSKKHHRSMAIFEMMCRAGFQDGGNGIKMAYHGLDEYDNIVTKYYPTDNEYLGNLALLTCRDLIYQGKIGAAIDKLNELYLDQNKVMPFSPITRGKILDLYYQFCIQQDSVYEAMAALREDAHVKAGQFGQDAPETHLARLKANYFMALYAGGVSNAIRVFKQSWEEIVKPQIATTHESYISILNMEGKLFEMVDRFKESRRDLVEAQNLIEKHFGSKDIRYGEQLSRIAELDLTTGNYKMAQGRIEAAMEIISNAGGSKSIEYIRCLRIYSRLFSVLAQFDDAERILDKSLELQNKTYQSASAVGGGNANDEEARIYYLRGNYWKAEEGLLKTIASREKYSTENQDLITPLLLLGDIYLVTGDFVFAEKMIRRAGTVAKSIFTDTSLRYLETQMVLARLNAAMGDFDKAEEAFKNLATAYTRKLGPDHVEVANAYTQLALIKYENNAPAFEVENLLVKTKVIISKSLGTEHPQYAVCLKNLATLYVDQGKLDLASDNLDKAQEIFVAKLNRRNPNIGDCYSLVGDVARFKKNFKKAENSYIKAKEIYKDIMGPKHPKYVQIVGRQARMEYIKGDKKLALKLLEETTTIYLSYIGSFFGNLSDREKTRFWNLIKPDFEFYTSLALELSAQNPELITKVYNNSLNTKAVLLSSSQKLRNQILASKDAKVISDYKTWIGKREQLALAIGLSPEQQKDKKLNPSALEEEIEQLEKLLSANSEAFNEGKETRKYAWQDIKTSLAPNEYAVELIRYRYFNSQFTDSVIYAALIINRDSKQPDLVLLKNGSFLESKGIKFYRNSIKLQVEDETSYNNFWAPIKAKIPDNATVYLSSDGIYNQLNVETLMGPNGKYVLEANNVILVGSTRDLINQSKKSGKKPRVEQVSNSEPLAMLVGNPTYYASIETVGNTQGDTINYDNFAQLPGTELEIKQVDKLLTANKWKTQTILNDKATESLIKNMNNPRVFHVATHGFFLELDESDGDNVGLKSETKLNENAMLRSGILMANGGDLFRKKGGINGADGVLTAYEAMNLNLDNTELVVLSACETGLGKINAGEGVYGLQRALLVAGAKSVVMSLFKVDDKASQELMVAFYQNWLKTGNKRQAFADAKKSIKQQYPHPFYWGAFVMMGK